MSINQLNTANTFEQWLIATEQLIATANLLTDGNGETFVANTILEIDGSVAQLNVRTSADINDLYANTATILGLDVTNDLEVGGELSVTGNVTITGNLTLDNIGFDDLNVAGSGEFGNNLTVLGETSLNTVNVEILTVNTNVDIVGSSNIGGELYIAGNLIVGGNLVLDNVGFNDLFVAGNTSIDGTLNVDGETTLSTANITLITGSSVNQFDASGTALALSIALG